MKLLYDTHCIIHISHGVYGRDNVSRDFLELHKTVS